MTNEQPQLIQKYSLVEAGTPTLLSLLLFYAALFLIFFVAICVRVYQNDSRPMHTDEAVQAYKFGELLEKNHYRYDKTEYHGPTLNYFTLPIAWISGTKTYAQLTESQLRAVPLIFGSALILLLILVVDGLGYRAALYAGLFAAISPGMVYYSRYYIHEMLLVFFSSAAIACGWRFFQSGKRFWAIACSISLALMFATKETCIIAYGAMFCGLAAVYWRADEATRDKFKLLRASLDRRTVLLCGVAFFATIGILFSSFFTNTRGVIDAIAAYETYFTRAGTEGGRHQHPWYFYLRILAYFREGNGPSFSESLVTAFAVAGVIMAFVKSNRLPLPLFLAGYTLALLAIYSVIPYKTPWCILGALHAMTLLAGFGFKDSFFTSPKSDANEPLSHFRIKEAIILALFVSALVSITKKANFELQSDERNPYAYNHTIEDIYKLKSRMEALAAVSSEGHDMPVQVIASPDNTWPLPWYLRNFKNTGYFSEMLPENLLKDRGQQVFITAVDTPLPDSVLADYQGESYGLRPGVILSVYIKRDLWEKFMSTRK